MNHDLYTNGKKNCQLFTTETSCAVLEGKEDHRVKLLRLRVLNASENL